MANDVMKSAKPVQSGTGIGLAFPLSRSLGMWSEVWRMTTTPGEIFLAAVGRDSHCIVMPMARKILTAVMI
jgi:hypothetical protein